MKNRKKINSDKKGEVEKDDKNDKNEKERRKKRGACKKILIILISHLILVFFVLVLYLWLKKVPFTGINSFFCEKFCSINVPSYDIDCPEPEKCSCPVPEKKVPCPKVKECPNRKIEVKERSFTMKKIRDQISESLLSRKNYQDFEKTHEIISKQLQNYYEKNSKLYIYMNEVKIESSIKEEQITSELKKTECKKYYPGNIVFVYTLEDLKNNPPNEYDICIDFFLDEMVGRGDKETARFVKRENDNFINKNIFPVQFALDAKQVYEHYKYVLVYNDNNKNENDFSILKNICSKM